MTGKRRFGFWCVAAGCALLYAGLLHLHRRFDATARTDARGKKSFDASEALEKWMSNGYSEIDRSDRLADAPADFLNGVGPILPIGRPAWLDRVRVLRSGPASNAVNSSFALIEPRGRLIKNFVTLLVRAPSPLPLTVEVERIDGAAVPKFEFRAAAGKRIPWPNYEMLERGSRFRVVVRTDDGQSAQSEFEIIDASTEDRLRGINVALARSVADDEARLFGQLAAALCCGLDGMARLLLIEGPASPINKLDNVGVQEMLLYIHDVFDEPYDRERIRREISTSR